MRLVNAASGWVLFCGLLTLLAGCAPTTARPVSTYAGPALVKPQRVLVVDFTVSPDQISLNRGPFASRSPSSDGSSPSAEQIKLGKEVAGALSEDLVKRIRMLGLPAERAAAGSKAAPGMMVIEGQFVSIDEGSQAKRLIVGFGAGSSEVKTLAQVYVGAATGPVLAQTFETEAKSAPTPGLVAGGPAVAAGRLAVAGVGAAVKVGSEMRKGVAADAERTAEELGKRLGEFFVAQGWIAKDAIK